MKKTLIIALITAIFAVSCTKKTPEYANSIPDKAFAVVSMHPKQIHNKGKIDSFESIKKEIDKEIIKAFIEDPASSGLDINNYMYLFVYFLNDEPIIGTVAGVKDQNKFEKFLIEILEEEEEIIKHEGLSVVMNDDESAAIGWDSKQALLLVSPEEDMSQDALKAELSKCFNLPKEGAITSIVDFKDFSGKMKDLNIWFTGDQMKKIIEMMDVPAEVNFNFPFDFYSNNYQHIFVDFSDGAMYVTSETNFSDDVEKAKETFMVAKDELNKTLLKIAPGNDLIMALAYSVDIHKMKELMKNFMPPQAAEMNGQIEEATGMTVDEIVSALSGDFVVAVNGAPEGSAIPVEILVGLGLDDETIQDKIMGKAGEWAPVEQDGDFFMINANGLELYSGLVDGIWVVTNAAGYKDAISSKGGLEKTLKDSKFADFSGGATGIYINLDMSSYPAGLQAMLANGPGPVLNVISESMEYMGMEASNSEGLMTLRTTKDNENSLYTILKMIDKFED